MAKPQQRETGGLQRKQCLEVGGSQLNYTFLTENKKGGNSNI